jgi:hypothetical protein
LYRSASDGCLPSVESARAGHCYSPASSHSFVRAPEHPGEFLSLANTLPVPGASGSTLMAPPGTQPIVVDPGETKPLGAARLSRVEVLRVALRLDGLTGLTKLTVTVTALGGRSILAWSALEAGHPVGYHDLRRPRLPG